MQEVFIVAARRTPIGGLMGKLSHLPATVLGGMAMKAAYIAAGLDPDRIDEVYFGNVLSADLGQAPARQAAIFAGIPPEKDATTINKVCSSGMKSLMLGAQQLMLGVSDIVMTGGMESMSNAPHYHHLRQGHKFGHVQFTDGMIRDGLWDPYHNFHMGSAAEMVARKYELSREMQDEYAISSYGKAVAATAAGKLAAEIIPVSIPGTEAALDHDEDIYKLLPEKVSRLSPAFEKDGTITAANASNLNDGAAALLLATGAAVSRYGLKPLARIIGFADAAQAPEWFGTSPALAIPKALQAAGLNRADIDLFEINEAYAAVALANCKILDIDQERVNIYGGAVAIGHPLGASGARITGTLVHALQQENKRYGVAAICNGGGGASAVVLERFF